MRYIPVSLQDEGLGVSSREPVLCLECITNDAQSDTCNLQRQPCNDEWRKQSSVTAWIGKVTFFFVLLLFLSLLFVSRGESAGTLLDGNEVLNGGNGGSPGKSLVAEKSEGAAPFSWSKVAGGSHEVGGKFMDSARSVEKDVSYFQIVKTLFALVLVIFVILGSLYVIKVMMGRGIGSSGDGGLVQVLATSFVGPKKAITIVRVAGEHLVLGITNSEISFLSKIESPEAIQQIESHKVAGGMPFTKFFEKFGVTTKKG